MSQDQCRAAFAHQPEKEIATQVHRATAAICGCEQFSMADNSPGPVQDPETLHLIVSDPTDLDDGYLSPASLVRLDTSGLSVLRDSAANDQFEQTIQELKARSAQANKKRSFLGVCMFSAHTVRYQNGDRFVGVYDTALPNKDHHADIVGPCLATMLGLSNRQAEKAKRKRIKELIGLVGRCFESSRTFRTGAFQKYS